MKRMLLALSLVCSLCTVFAQNPGGSPAVPSVSPDVSPPETDAKPMLTITGNLPQRSSQVMKAARGANSFGLDLFRALGATDQGNLFFSPTSIHIALAMTFTGAKANTASEMEKVLRLERGEGGGLSPAGNEFFKAVQGIGASAKYRVGVEIRVANSLWGMKGFAFLPEFLKNLETGFSASFGELDFSQSEESRKVINNWVSEKTSHKIMDLIQPGMLSELTRLVLTNAVYFKGTWDKPFEKELTVEKPFRLNGEKSVLVPMMSRTDRFWYFEDELCQGLRMDYRGGELSFHAFLPLKQTDLKDLEKAFSGEKFEEWARRLSQIEIAVTLPKFKMESSFKLKDFLVGLGMPQAFSPDSADFSGMVAPEDWQRMLEKNDRIRISEVIHKTFVDVNEEGTEAAAATAVLVEGGGGPPPKPREFTADRPFLFLIRHNPTGSILFLGRVADPTGK